LIKLFVFLCVIVSVGAQDSSKIYELNRKIHDLYFEIESFQFDKTYKKLDDILIQCNNIDYIIGESDIIQCKVIQAITLGQENIIYNLLDEYNLKLEESITYGLSDKELYYKSLTLILSIYLNGFDYQRESFETLVEQAEYKGSTDILALALWILYTYEKGLNKTKYSEKLHYIFENYLSERLKYLNIAYLSAVGQELLQSNNDLDDAKRYFKEAKDLAEEIELNQYSSVYNYFIVYTNLMADTAVNVTDLNNASKILESIKENNFTLYISEIPKIAQIHNDKSLFKESEILLTNSIEYFDNHINKYDNYFQNMFNSRIFQNVMQFPFQFTIEQYKALILIDLYEALSWSYLGQANGDSTIQQLENGLEAANILDYSGRAIEICLYLSEVHDILGNTKESKSYVDRAIRYTSKITNKDCESGNCRIIYIFDIIDFLETNNHILLASTHFRKSLSLLNDALEEAIKLSDHQFEYNCYVRLAHLHYLVNKDMELQFDYFSKADSILDKHKLKPDRDRDWLFVYLLSKKKKFDKISIITARNFEYFISQGNYWYAFNYGIKNYNLYIYQISPNENSKEELFSRIRLLETQEIDYQVELALHIFKSNLLINEANRSGNYAQGLTLVDDFISYYDKVYTIENDEILSDYINWGMWLMNLASFADDTSTLNKLQQFIHPIQLQYSTNVTSDMWMIQFYNDTKGSFNKELYDLYINKIFNYPLSIERIKQKILHGDLLVNKYGDYSNSIKYYEEALVESKKLNNLELELKILKDLGILYGTNRQYELSERRLKEALTIGNRVGNVDILSIIYNHLFELNYNNRKDQFYELAKQYFRFSKSYYSYIPKIQSIGHLIDYFSYQQEPDSIIKYFKKGLFIKDSVIIIEGPLIYLNFLQSCYDAVNEDMTGIIIDPINQCAIGNLHTNRDILNIYNELVYLKDYSYDNIESYTKNSFPFVYYKSMNRSEMLKRIWDDVYQQYPEFENNLHFLLNVDVTYRQWGYINVLWALEDRIKKIEEYSGRNTYFGFGINYNVQNGKLLVSDVLNDSPATDLILFGDEIVISDVSEINENDAINFFKDKVNEATIDLVPFSIVRKNIDTIRILLKPEWIKPNPYSDNPIDEIEKCTNLFFQISDTLISNSDYVRNYPSFARTYKQFLIFYPYRYFYTHNSWISSGDVQDLLDRYEQLSTYGLVYQSIKHKEILESNPLLVQEYLKHSNKINSIQVQLQDDVLNQNEINECKKARYYAYNELNYFENYTIEKGGNNSNFDDFSYNNSIEYFNEFDAVIRYCKSETSLNGVFSTLNNTNTTSFHYTAKEDELAVIIKSLKNLLSQTAYDTSLQHNLLNSLIDITQMLNPPRNTVPIIADNIGALNFLVVPEGVMNLYPYELLLFRYESDTTEYHFLGEIVNVTYAPSLASYVQFKSRANNKSKNVLLASANPNSNKASLYSENLLALRSDLGNIEYVDEEIQSISSSFRKQKRFWNKREIDIFDSANISEKIFKSNDLSKYRYLHIAAHGIHDQENPDYSGILLGRDENDYEDGILQAHEIFPLNLSADLVTLSSCFSGFGEIDPHEGNLGIYRSFLLAGSKSVIISLWDVEDESTSILFSKFYEYLIDGKSKSEALRMSKLYLMNETQFSHPFYWAPFILIGGS